MVEEKDLSQIWIPNFHSMCPATTTLSAKMLAIDQLYERLTENKQPVADTKKPHMIITIGAPGSGKSTMTKSLIENWCNESISSYVWLDWDNVLDYFATGANLRNVSDIRGNPTNTGAAYGWEFCINKMGYITHEVFIKILDKRFNLVVQVHDHQLLIDAQCHEYVCTLFYVAVSIETAKRRAAIRAFETGRFIEPASEKNGWGWHPIIENTWYRHRIRAPFFACWADNFILINNEQDNFKPKKSDFIQLSPHPKLLAGQNWHDVIDGLISAISHIHGEKDF